jgi:hypothetical protein
MAELFVTCPECGLRGELAHSGREFADPPGKCKHLLNPAKCPSLRIPLIGARHLLDMFEWDAFLAADEEIADEDAPEVFPTLPLVAQDRQAIRQAPTDEPDAVGGERWRRATGV